MSVFISLSLCLAFLALILFTGLLSGFSALLPTEVLAALDAVIEEKEASGLQFDAVDVFSGVVLFFSRLIPSDVACCSGGVHLCDL